MITHSGIDSEALLYREHANVPPLKALVIAKITLFVCLFWSCFGSRFYINVKLWL